MTTRRIPAADGVVLALHRLRAFRDKRAAVLLVHGAFTSHRVWLAGPSGGFARYLGAAGFDVWVADLRHHGESEREPHPGTWTFEDWILKDAPAFVARIRDETGGASVTWIGHSAGGAAGLCWLARSTTPGPLPLDAIVTLGTPGPRRMGPVRWSLAAATIGVATALGRFPARTLRVGSEDEAAGILAQWMRWNVRGAWVGADGFDYYSALADVRTPYLGVAGSADGLFAPPSACRHLVERVAAARKDFVVARGLSHRGLALSPRARETAWPAIAQWLRDAP